MAVCRSCHGTIRFVRLDTGKSVPVDPIASHQRGTIAARSDGRNLTGYRITKDRPDVDPGFLRYRDHHGTCHPREERRLASERTPNLPL